MNELSEKKRITLERLREIGIQFEEHDDSYDFMIPQDLTQPRCVEIGFLMGQLNAGDYPDGFSSLSDLPSKVYPKITKRSPVHFVESYPEFLLYRIYKKKE